MVKIAVFRKGHRLFHQCRKDFLADALIVVSNNGPDLLKIIYGRQFSGKLGFVFGFVVNQKFSQKRTAVIMIFLENFLHHFLRIVKKPGRQETKNRFGLGFLIRCQFGNLVLSDLSGRHPCIDRNRRLFTDRTARLNGLDLCADRGFLPSDCTLDFDALHRRFRAFCYGDYPCNQRFQIAVKGLFPCVKTLPSGKHLRQLGGVHSVIGNNQGAIYLQAFPHPFQEACPLVFHPDRLKVFGLAAVNNHHRGGVQGIVDVRFVFFGNLIPQSFPAEKHAVALTGKISIEVGNFNTVIRALNIVFFIGILEA